MANELQPLSVLFQNRLFRIPDYQRGYAWKHEQLVDFWEDLINLHEDRYHYIGLLSLKALNKSDLSNWQGDEWLLKIGYKPYHVVDGQQRLTTFSILLNEIVIFVNHLPENKHKEDEEIFIGFESLKDIKAKYLVRKRPPQNLISTYLFGYETDNPSADYLRYKIFEEPFEKTIFETYYTKNLKYAKEFFKENLSATFTLEGLRGIEVLYRKLTLQFMFNLHEIEDDYDVFVAFETMNNRGKKLTNLELLKNRLIYLTTLFDDQEIDEIDKEQLRNDINEAWKEVYHQLGRNKERPLLDDEFLRAHWITYFQYSRNKGDDYIHYLLSKFSAKSIFEKHTVKKEIENNGFINDYDQNDDDVAEGEFEVLLVSKLAPLEISNYVNSLKNMAKYWYNSYFPYDSEYEIEEKYWLDKLNRIGIGYFRPLVVSAFTNKDTTPEERISLLQAIERFIFVCFRIGNRQSTHRSSFYYKKAREILNETASLSSIADNLDCDVEMEAASAIASFITSTNRRFENGEGFYGWSDLRYFLYEYESEKATKNNLQKVDWKLFTKVEKDKITIEHILPKTATKLYWRNTYRKYSPLEIRVLSGSLGNLLLLAQSINSSLQNDEFLEKKNPTSKRHRGYINGSHSEIEVALEKDWTAENILKRGLILLDFMEIRWNITITKEQKQQLLHLDFINEVRADVPEITKIENIETDNSNSYSKEELSKRKLMRIEFWQSFVEYCLINGHDDITIRKPGYDDWYDVPIGSHDYHIFFQIYKREKLRIGLYVYKPESFARLEAKKEAIEKLCGFNLEWYTSREKSIAKRILYNADTDIDNPALKFQHFAWLIEHFYKLKYAIDALDKIN